ncbi:hypothetical protein [Kingella kingae]|uniref:hypothetical protein n=1 Tax=Kingella kingae TaxID=504 RepID=UPI000409FF8F|nr:hypothetical protein [Kingella kingae]
METLAYSCAGCLITWHNSRRAQRNIILRPRDPSSLHISIPPWFTQTQLRHVRWHVTKRCCKKQPAHRNRPNICLIGFGYTVKSQRLIVSPNIAHIALHQSSLHLPNAQREPLQQWLWQQAV